MELVPRFLAYAQAFEETYRDDSWTRLEPFFAEDAVYEVENSPFACRVEGREAIFRAIRKSIDGFDRRFDQRDLEVLAPPTEADGEVHIPWAATYVLGDHPPLRITARTRARYEGGRIVHLVDSYDGAGGDLSPWAGLTDPPLDPSYV